MARGPLYAGMHYAGGPAGLTREARAEREEEPTADSAVASDDADYDDWEWLERGA